jgi:hypothetical protein
VHYFTAYLAITVALFYFRCRCVELRKNSWVDHERTFRVLNCADLYLTTESGIFNCLYCKLVMFGVFFFVKETVCLGDQHAVCLSVCVRGLVPKTFRVKWLLYIPRSLTLKNSMFCPDCVFICFVCMENK